MKIEGGIAFMQQTAPEMGTLAFFPVCDSLSLELFGGDVRISIPPHPPTVHFNQESEDGLVGWKIICQSYIQVLIPGTCECDLFWRKDVAGVIKLRVLR